MLRHLVVLVLVLTFVATSAEATCGRSKLYSWSRLCKIRLQLKCTVKYDYLAMVYMYDYDTVGEDDLMLASIYVRSISKTGWLFATRFESSSIVELRGLGYDGDFGGEVEPYLMIYHTCNTAGTLTLLTIGRNDFDIIRSNYDLGVICLDPSYAIPVLSHNTRPLCLYGVAQHRCNRSST